MREFCRCGVGLKTVPMGTQAGWRRVIDL